MKIAPQLMMGSGPPDVSGRSCVKLHAGESSAIVERATFGRDDYEKLTFHHMRDMRAGRGLMGRNHMARHTTATAPAEKSSALQPENVGMEHDCRHCARRRRRIEHAGRTIQFRSVA